MAPTANEVAAMVETFKVCSWNQFEEIYERRFRPKRGVYYYRGQSNDSWELQTTHERLFSRISEHIPTEEPYPSYSPENQASTPGSRIELLALRAFQARSTRFLSNLPTFGDTLEWLALMRHWGMPTRLMDVTTSPYVALYFALCDRLGVSTVTPTNAAVWAISHTPLRCVASRAVDLPDHTDLSDPDLFCKLLIYPRKLMVAPVHPRTHNERLTAQQGTFLCVGNPDASFSENLLGCMPDTEVKDQKVLYKFVIDHNATPEILGRLSTMNIHQASLFPDLGGYARFVENSLVLFSMRGSYYSEGADWESLERLGWLG
jgi:hypothetical protein